MHNHQSPATVPPVLDCMLPDGYATVLLNPAMTPRQWRRRQALSLVRPTTILKGLFAAGLAIQISCAGHGFGEKFGIGLVTLIVVLGLFRLLCRPPGETSFEYEGVPRLRLRWGEFYRRRDFDDLGGDSRELVAELLTGVQTLHRSPALAWLDPALPGEIHTVVWRTLCCLDRTREARALADEVAAELDTTDDLVTATRRAVDDIDTSLREVARQVRGCVVLCRAWEQKLRRHDLAARVSHTLAAIPGQDHLTRLSQDSDALPRNVFAHVTAARDITHSGAFPWEQPPSEWPGAGGLPVGRIINTPSHEEAAVNAKSTGKPYRPTTSS
ncbi:hypothetical protein [Amycolatopsis keratiniphila]|uniref:Uncharacterized protein n=1 Tax=Amycolatopsis keratiniphila TaxID=129921 RepID=R4SUL4_9PSEU|nr:hypothetical protein [Amycolatopsis keratiniphila]AGM07064.1 hypothetical protein AORI_4480 [Amycolatopsis keratiniphila]